MEESNHKRSSSSEIREEDQHFRPKSRKSTTRVSHPANSAMRKIMGFAHRLVPRVHALSSAIIQDDVVCHKKKRDDDVDEDDLLFEEMERGIVSGEVASSNHEDDNSSINSDIRLLDEEAEALLKAMNSCYADTMMSRSQSFDLDDDSSLDGELTNLTGAVDILRRDMANAAMEFGEADETNMELQLQKMIQNSYCSLRSDTWRSSWIWTIAILWALFLLMKGTNKSELYLSELLSSF